MYMPTVVVATHYFEKRLSLAIGIAACGSGVGTFILAPLTSLLVTNYSWKGAILIIAALNLHCCVFGATYRPVKSNSKKERIQSIELSDRLFTSASQLFYYLFDLMVFKAYFQVFNGISPSLYVVDTFPTQRHNRQKDRKLAAAATKNGTNFTNRTFPS